MYNIYTTSSRPTLGGFFMSCIGNPNPVKFGRCILELERMYGIKHGGDRRSEDFKSSNGTIEKTQDELLKELGIEVNTYKRYKKLAQLPEDIQQAICDGVITQSVASRLIAKLPLEDQEELRIYGIRHGNNQHKEDSTNGEIQKTQDELLNEIGISRVGAARGAGCLGEPYFSIFHAGNVHFTVNHDAKIFHIYQTGTTKKPYK